ncbi:MAG: YceI family protein [Flavobacteriaceae bacterium]|nr:YceI family protein [Flavobacteriaceae bacterium]
MKKLIVIMLVITGMSVTAQQSKWTIDNDHTRIQFSINHMVISEITGYFKSFEGLVLAEKENFSDAIVNFSIEAGSIDTGVEKRDSHLKSADFFDVQNHPKITFKGKSIKSTKKSKYKIKGDLTLHGITKEITLNVNYGGTVKDPYGRITAGLKITGLIKRSDFGLKYNSILESGGLLIGDEVSLDLSVRLLKQK